MIRFWPRKKQKEEARPEAEKPIDAGLDEVAADGVETDRTDAPDAEEPVTDAPAAQGDQPEPVVAMGHAPRTARNDGPPVTDTSLPVRSVTVDAAAYEAAHQATPAEPVKKGWLSRLREGLSRSSSRLTDGIGGIFTKRRLDDETLEELEELLITADLGPATAAKLTAALAKNRFGKEISPEEVREALAEQVETIIRPVARPLIIDPSHRPHVILMVGVNGTGKTTTIGKLAKQLRADGKSVVLAAGDTFRAAAVSQLKIWGERTGCAVIAKDTGADAAGLAYEALEKARRDGADVLLIDTAGRLQNKSGLMAELQKIVRVLKKLDPSAPHGTLLTLDATTGQNAHAQVEVFSEMVQVNGLILTKLDGSARGGVLVSLAEKFAQPVHAIGVGEGVDDLRPFEARAFARSLMGLEV